MSSVSVLPPHPPSMSAARKLALALAQSAQKASSCSQRKGNIQRSEAPHGQDRPPRPSVLDLEAYPQEYRSPQGPCASQWQTSGRDPVESQRCPHPFHFLPEPLGSESLQVTVGQEGLCNFTPNVSPLGSGSLDERSTETSDRREEKELSDVTRRAPSSQTAGVSTPTHPVCSTQSPSTSPVYMNTDSVNMFNFRAVLAETSMPASVEEVLPHRLQPPSTRRYSPEADRPLGPIEDVYSNHYRPRDRPLHTAGMPAHHCPRPVAPPRHLFRPKTIYRQSSESRYSSLGLRHPLSPQYRCYHRDELLMGGYHRSQGPWQRSEERMVGHPAIRRARSFHTPHMSHYGPADKEARHPDSMFYVEHISSQEVPCQRIIQTSIHPVQFENTNYRYSPYSGMNPLDGSRYYDVEPFHQGTVGHGQYHTVRSTSGQSDYYSCSPRRAPPASRELYREGRDCIAYEARGTEGFERVVYQVVKPETTSRCRNTCLAMSPTKSPVSPSDTRNRDIIHTRSKSDPGNACLLSANKKENQNAVVATSPTSHRSQPVDQPFGHLSSAEPRPPRCIQIKQQPPLRRVPSLPERACPNNRSMEHNKRSHTRGHIQDGFTMAGAAHGYAAAVRPGILRRPGRSQSTRETRHHYHPHTKSPLDAEPPGSFPTQLNRRTQSTKVRPTHYDHMEGYYAVPKPTRAGKVGGGYVPGQGSTSPGGHRVLSEALGNEAFYHAALRSEAGVYD